MGRLVHPAPHAEKGSGCRDVPRSSPNVPCWASELLTGAPTPRNTLKSRLVWLPPPCPLCGPLGAAPSFLGTTPVTAPAHRPAMHSLTSTVRRHQSWRQPTCPRKAAWLGPLRDARDGRPFDQVSSQGRPGRSKVTGVHRGGLCHRRRTQWTVSEASTPMGGQDLRGQTKGPGTPIPGSVPICPQPTRPSRHGPMVRPGQTEIRFTHMNS